MNTVYFGFEKKRLLLAIAFTCFICLLANSQSSGNILHNWSLAAKTTTNIGGNTAVSKIASDNNGNIYVAGTFSGTSDFDPSSSTANLSASGGNDVFFAKYDATGNYIYSKKLGGSGDETLGGIFVDGSGDIYITGTFNGTADFDPGSAVENLTTNGNKDLFFAKYDVSGNYVYAKSIGSTSVDEARSITVDLFGSVYLTGIFTGTVDFDPSAATNTLSSNGTNSDCFIARYDNSGNYLFSKTIAGSSVEIPTELVLDNSGSLILTGYFLGTVDFDPSASTFSISSGGSTDFFFAKYDANGNFTYVKKVGGSSGDVSYSVDTDAFGAIYLTGYFYGTVDFDPSGFIVNLSAASGNVDMFFAKYDSNGNYIFAKRVGGTGWEQGNSITVDAQSNCYITGIYDGTVDFDPSSSTTNLVSNGAQDLFIAKYDASGNYIYAKSVGGPNTDNGSGIVVNQSGHVYVGGLFYAIADFDPSSAVVNLTAPNCDGFFAAYDANGNYLFAKQLGTYFHTAFVSATCIKQDAAGNTYVAGNCVGEINFDPLAPGNHTVAPYDNMFLLKYDNAGNLIFGHVIGGTGYATATSLVLDAAGNIYLTGQVSFTVDFDPSPATATLSGIYGDVYFAKYDANGNFIYAKSIGGTNQDFGQAIGVDITGAVYITGNFSGSGDFDPAGSSTVTLYSNGNSDIFIAKYDAAGNFVFAKNIGSSGPEDARAITVDSSGNFIITGYFQNTLDFDPSPLTATLSGNGNSHMYFAKYDSNGNYIFAKSASGFGTDVGNAIAQDASGAIYITGSIGSTSDFDPSASTANLTSVGMNDVFIAKYDVAGNYLFAKAMGGIGQDFGNAITLDDSKNIYITGSFQYTVDLNPSSLVLNVITSGLSDIFIAKYDSTGAFVFGKNIGCPGQDKGTSVVADPSGNTLTVAGVFKGIADADPNSGVVNLSSNNFDGMFLAKYNQCLAPPSATNTTAPANQIICAMDSATLSAVATSTLNWFSSPTSTTILSTGNTFITPALSAGIYTFYVDNIDGCAPAAFRTAITVTVNTLPTITVNNGTLCAGDSYTFYPSGATSYTIQGGTFTVNPATSSGYIISGTGVNGCVNHTTASVTVNPLPVISVNSGSICNGNSFTLVPSGAASYTFEGGSAIVSPTSNATYTVTGTSSVGCKASSFATSTVDVYNLPLPVISVNSGSICTGESFVLVPSGAHTYTFSGGSSTVSPPTSTNYSITGTDINGCLSQNPAISTVWVNASPTVIVNSGNMCAGESFTIVPTGGDTYTFSSNSPVVSPSTTTQYTVFATAANGCTNAAVTEVTVNPIPVITVSNGSVCINSSYTLNPGGAGSYTFSSGSAIVTPTTLTSYTITGTSAAGCAASNTAIATVSVSLQPTITVNSGAICPGEAFTITPSGANTYTFSTGTPIVYPSANSSFSVIGSSADGCLSANLAVAFVTVYPTPTVTASSGSICSGNSFTITPSGAATYFYQGGNAVVSPTANSTYTVSGFSSEGCPAATAAIVNVTVLPVSNISVNSGSVCNGNSFTITPSGTVTYTISGNNAVVTPSTTTAYTITGSGSNGCTSQAVSVVSVIPLPVISISTSSSLICVGQTVSITASGALTYTWNATAQGPVIVDSPTVNVTYTVTGSDANGCENTDTLTQFVTTCTGFAKSDNYLHEINLYPNPTTGKFIIECFQPTDLMILNSAGAVIIHIALNEELNEIDLSGVSKGIYFIRTVSNQKIKAFKLIID